LEKSEQQHKDTKKPKKSKNKKKTKKSSASTKSTVDDFLKDIAQPANTPSDDSTSNDLCNLLAIDVQHLQVANEMRRLFGRAAFHEDEHQSASEQRRPREGEGASLADAVTGKMAYGGPGLPAMLRRRNLFAQGKEDWPRATGGGLGMETVEARSNGVTEYRFVHNAGYQHAQREFENCVLGMDPNSMVHLLRFNRKLNKNGCLLGCRQLTHNPAYHVSTLLQVSEIAKQEKDYATTGLLLERALFSFGRALPTSFAAKLAQGKARLDFRRPENREFWLTVWRYIANIGMRATWRTAYEWARLLLALDPEGDHYCMCLIIDQYALRAHQAGNFLALTKSRYFADKWRHLPNIRFSASLAAKMGGADASTCEKTLAEVMQQYPWVTARLLQELSIDKIPPSIWGITPSSEKDTLYTELYATLAKDLWKAPEALSFLTRSCAALSSTGGGGGGSTTTAAPNPPNTEPISIDEARHVLLTDRPALIALVPRSITSTVDSMSDPLPPTDNLPSYTVLSRRVAQQRNTAISLNDDDEDDEEGAAAAPEDLIATNPRQFITELDELQRFFEYIIPGVAQPVGGGGGGEGGYNQDGGDAPRDISDEIVEQAMVRASVRICRCASMEKCFC